MDSRTGCHALTQASVPASAPDQFHPEQLIPAADSSDLGVSAQALLLKKRTLQREKMGLPGAGEEMPQQTAVHRAASLHA